MILVDLVCDPYAW